jgi:hypothetical protein
MGCTVRGSNAGGGEIFRTCPDRPWGPPSLLYNGYRDFPGSKEWPGREAYPSPPSSTVGHERVELYSPYGPYGLYRASVPVQGCTLPYSRAIPLLPLWAVQPVQSLSACTRVHFTFYLFTSTQRKDVKYCEATYCIPGGEYQNSEEHSASNFSIGDTGRQQLLSRRLNLSNCMVAHPRTQ